jgi:hypothetical protein
MHSGNIYSVSKFQVLTVLTTKNDILWEVTEYSLVEADRYFWRNIPLMCKSGLLFNPKVEDSMFLQNDGYRKVKYYIPQASTVHS